MAEKIGESARKMGQEMRFVGRKCSKRWPKMPPKIKENGPKMGQ